MESLPKYFPLLCTAGVFLIACGALWLLALQLQRKRKGEPLAQMVERFPGQSQLERLDEGNREIAVRIVSVFTVPVIVFAAYISSLYVAKQAVEIFNSLIIAVFTVVYTIYTIFKLVKQLRQRLDIRLGYEARAIVGQTLNSLMLSGYRVYHDFPGDEFNIDHIVVCDKGVFAIETRTRYKRSKSDRKAEATVEYDGCALHFPNGTDTKMIEQAKRQSKWLSQWLSQAVGEDIPVRSILTLPGWFVKRTASKGIPVVDPERFDSLFAHIKPIPLTVEMVTRIARQLDQKCEDIKSSSMED